MLKPKRKLKKYLVRTTTRSEKKPPLTMETRKPTIMDTGDKYKYLTKKDHDSYEVDGETTFVKAKKNKKNIKRLFGGTKDVYKAKGDENSPIKSIKEKTVKGKDGLVKENSRKIKYKKTKNEKDLKKRKRKADRMQARALRKLDKGKESKAFDLLDKENKLREKY